MMPRPAPFQPTRCHRCGEPGASWPVEGLPDDARVHVYCLSKTDHIREDAERALLRAGARHTERRTRRGYKP